MNNIVVSAFPGCGKSACARMRKDCYDHETSPYHNNNTNNWVEDYINDLIKIVESDKYNYIFVSTHKEVREALRARGIHYIIVTPYPFEGLRNEWVGRFFLRGSSPEFCQKIADNWYDWIEDLRAEEDDIFYLSNDQYLSEILMWLKGKEVCRE